MVQLCRYMKALKIEIGVRMRAIVQQEVGKRTLKLDVRCKWSKLGWDEGAVSRYVISRKRSICCEARKVQCRDDWGIHHQTLWKAEDYKITETYYWERQPHASRQHTNSDPTGTWPRYRSVLHSSTNYASRLVCLSTSLLILEYTRYLGHEQVEIRRQKCTRSTNPG